MKYFEQIYHVMEGYWRKIPVKGPSNVPRVLFVANSTPYHDISVSLHRIDFD